MKNRIQKELTEALKSSNSDKVRTLRGFIAAIQVKEKSDGKELTNEDIINVLNKCIKQREESMKIFTEQNRIELSVIEETELFYLKEFLPTQLTEEELKTELTLYFNEIKSSEPNIHQGKLLGSAIKKFSSVADRNRITQTLNAISVR